MAALAGILIPSVLVVLALRRWYSSVPWSVAGLLFTLTIGFLHGAVFTRQMPVPFDEVMRGYPYRGVLGVSESRNPLTNDTVKQILPWMHVVREQLAAGTLPLWNPYQFGGYPLLGNGQSAPFAPLFLATLFVPLPRQLVAMAGLKIFLALLFGYLFLREEEVSPAAAVFGSAVFAFSVFQTVYLYYPLTTVSSLLPAAAFAVRGSMRDGRHRWTVLLALVTATVASSGHPETAVHIGIAILIGVTPLSLRPVRAALLGLLLAAPAWVPVVEQALRSTRAAALRGVTHPPYPGAFAWLLLNPDGFGNPARGTWQWIYNYSIVAPTYIGLVTLVLLAAVPFSRPRRRDVILLVSIVVLFLVAMNWTIAGRAINSIPPLNLSANDRLRFVIAFFAGILGARTVDRLRLAPAAVSSVVIGGAAIWLLHAKWNVTLGIATSGGVLALAIFWIGRARPTAAAVAILVELFAFNSGFNALTPAAWYRPRLPILGALAASSRGEPSRMVGHDWTFLPNAASQYGFEDIRGSDPMAPVAYARYFERLAVQDASDVRRVQDLDRPELERLGVRFAITDPGVTPGESWTLRYEGPDGNLYEAKKWNRRFFGDAGIGPIEQRSPAHLRFRVDAAKPVFIASSQAFAPGWRVTVDGKRVPVEPVDGAFIGFRVPAGSHDIAVRYLPMTFFLSLAGTLAAALALIRRRG
jgi:hypothetical protein